MITRPKEDIRQSIRNPEIDWLLRTSACERCVRFLAEGGTTSASKDIDAQLRRYEAGSLLVILVAMEAGSGCDVLEVLRVVGTRNVDAHGYMPDKERYRMAGQARHRPVNDPRHYERVHLPKMRQQLASEMHRLITHPDHLEAALETNGATAVAKYL